ncbi:hypothetical protein NY08_4701 [Rhodococcus sp. B7740]|nr:hypothetical protein NY08_4701 [Rhodococcus sp. B7740]
MHQPPVATTQPIDAGGAASDDTFGGRSGACGTTQMGNGACGTTSVDRAQG